MKKKIKIDIIDDHQIFIDSLGRLLTDDKNLNVVGGALNGQELLEVIKNESPDIILLDIEMPVMNGDDVLKIISKKYPGIHVIILSAFIEEEGVSHYMASGASGVLPKECNHEDLLDAIYSVMEKGFYFNDAIFKSLLTDFKKQNSNNSVITKISLSSREIEVLKLICVGKTNKKMAQILCLEPCTIDYHRRNLYNKTSTMNTASLVMYTVKNGLI